MDDSTEASKRDNPHKRMLKCFRMGDLTLRQQIVLAVIASHDGPGGAYPGVGTIAKLCGVERWRAFAVMKELKDKRRLDWDKDPGKVSFYRIPYDAPFPEPAPEPVTEPVTGTVMGTGGADPSRVSCEPVTGLEVNPSRDSRPELEENRKANVSERFPVLEGGSASAREPTVDAGAPPSRAHVVAAERKAKPAMLPSPETFDRYIWPLREHTENIRFKRQAAARGYSASATAQAHADWDAGK